MPQKKTPKNLIVEFKGKHRFLSNFYPAKVVLNSDVYSTVEHAYQAAKTNDLTERKTIQILETPGQAKRFGRKVTLSSNWDDVKLDVMELLVRQKFTNHKILKSWLLNMTKGKHIIEGNNWNDDYWGVPFGGTGDNHLGKIIMKIRDELL